MHRKSLRPIKLKTGQEFPIGTEFDVSFAKTDSGTDFLNVQNNEITFKTTRFSSFFKVPSIKTLEKWDDEGFCKTVTGHRTEPDGHGPDDSPSWLLALRVI